MNTQMMTEKHGTKIVVKIMTDKETNLTIEVNNERTIAKNKEIYKLHSDEFMQYAKVVYDVAKDNGFDSVQALSMTLIYLDKNIK